MNKRFLAVLLFLVPLSCPAVDYYLLPLFNVSERYNTNINMQPNPAQDNWITTISPGINFGLRDNNYSLRSNFTWNHLAYTNQSELDIDETLLNYNYLHKLSERLQLGFAGSYNSLSSLNPESTGTIQGGATFTQVQTEQLNFAPSITYQLSELDSASFSYSYSETTFDQSQVSDNVFLADYEYHQITGSISHIVTEKDLASITLSSSLYKSPFQNQTTYNHIAQIGWEHNFTDDFSASVAGGLNYSETESSFPALVPGSFLGIPIFRDPVTGDVFFEQRFETLKNSGIGQIFSISIAKSFERGSASLGISQNQTPTTRGLQTQMMVSLDSSYKIDDRWSSGLATTYSTFEASSSDTENNLSAIVNRTTFTIRPSLSWIWTPEISLGLSYTFRQQEFDQQPDLNSEGNLVQFQFSYQPQLNNQVK